jgi:autotransporter-associated beta strand protein
MKTVPARHPVRLGFFATLLVAQSATAADDLWNVDANGSWATAGSWASGVPGATGGIGNTDVATFGFPLTADRTVTVDANRNVGGILFDNATSAKYILSGGSLLLSSGGFVRTAADNGDHTDTISSAIVVQGDGGGATFTANAASGGSVLSIGAVTGVSTVGNTTTLTLNGGNGADNAVTGVIGNGTGGGSLAVTKSGTGVWVLGGTNSFSGQLTVEDGFLKVATVNNASVSGVLGNSALAVILGKSGGGTGTLEYTGGTATSTKKFTLATGGAGAFQVVSDAATLTLSGVIDGGGVLTKTGPGALNLSGANTFTGGVNLNSGKLTLSSLGALGGSGLISLNGGTLQFTSINRTDYSDRFSTGSGQSFNFDTNGQAVTFATGLTSVGGALTKTGTGTLTLTGANSYSGGTTVSAGTLALSGSGTLGAGSLTVDGSTAVASLGATSHSVGTVALASGGQITGTVGTGTLTGTAFNVSSGSISAILAGATAILTKEGSGTVTLSGANTYGGGTVVSDGSLVLSGATSTLGAATGSLTVDGSAAVLNLGIANPTLDVVTLANGGQIIGTGTLTGTAFKVGGGTIGASLAGPGALTKSDSGTLTLSGANTYTGATAVNAGTLQVTKALALPGQTTPGLIKVAGGATLGLNVGGTGEFTAGDLTNVLTNVTFSSGSVLGINATAAVSLATSVNGGFGLSKYGGSTLTLSEANNYSGGTTVNAGILAFTGAGTLGSTTGPLTVTGGGTVSLGTTLQTVGAVSLLSGTISGVGTGSLTGTSFQVESGAISAILNGAGAMLTKSNTGTVTLSGVNSYGGGTLITGGTLTVSTAGALGATSGELTVDGGTNGTAILNLGATLQTVGAVNLLNGAQITGTGTLTGTAFNVESGTLSAKLAGTGALIKTNAAGTVTLSGTNTYTGATEVKAGTLQVAKALSLPDLTTPGLIKVFGGATLAINAGGAGEFTAANLAALTANATFEANAILGIDTTTATGGVFNCNQTLVGAVGLTKLGTGTLTLSGTGNTYSGGTKVLAGTLTLTGPGTLGAGGGLLVDGATTVVNLGGTSQTVGAVSVLNGAQINTGTLTGTSFQVGGGSLGANLMGAGALLTKSTTGTVTLSGANTFGGGVDLLEGVLALGSGGALGSSGTIRLMGGTLQFGPNNQTDYSNRFSTAAGQSFNFDTNGRAVTLAADLTSAGGSLTKSGLGTLTLAGTNTYTGGTTVKAGTLQVGKAASLPGSVIMADGTTLAINAGGGGEFTAPELTLLLSNVILGNNNILAIDTSRGNFAYDELIGQAIGLVKLGGNTLTLSGANTYSGGTTIGGANLANAGTLQLAGAGTLGTVGPLVIYGGTLDLNGTVQAVTTLALGGGASGSTAALSIGAGDLKLGGNVTFSATNNPAGATVSGAGGGLLSLMGNRTFTVGDSAATAIDLTISAIIQNGDATARTLTKAGAGTLLLSGPNIYTGVTTVSAGTLQAAVPAALPGRTTAGRISVAGGATLAVNVGGAGEFAAADLTTLLANTSFTAASAAIGLDTTNAVGGTFSAPNFTGARSLSKLGSGTLILAGAGNTYTGNTTVTAGTLQVTGTLATGGLMTVPTGGVLEVASGASVTRSVTVSGGLLNLSGTLGSGSTLTLTDGTINSLGTAATAAAVALPLPSATTIFSAPTDQELTVTNKLTQTVSNGYFVFTAGTPAFKVGGSNLVNNVDKLMVRGGTTKIERYAGNLAAGLDVRAWQGPMVLEGAQFDLPGSPTHSTFAGTLGYATGSIHLNGDDHEHFTSTGQGSSGVLTGAMPTGYVNNYTVEYRGKLRIPTAGSYTFSVTSDDGGALWIDPATTNPAYATANVQIGGDHPMQQANSAPLTLTAGDHDIIVRFYENGGGNGIFVQWDPAGGANFVDIPGANFFHGSQTPAAVSLPATDLVVTGTNILNLSFGAAATLGNVSFTAPSALTFQTATSVSLGNLTAAETSSITAGPSLLLRTGNVTVADTKTLTITPALIDGTTATGLTKQGGGTLILSGANTYSGTTTVDAGTLTLAGASAATGATLLNGGTLTVTNANSLQRSNVTFNGGVLDTGALASVPLGGITANVDLTVSSVLTTISGYPTWSAAAGKTLTIGGPITRMPGAAINFGTAGTITGAPLGTLLGTNTITSWATAGGTDWAIYDGSKIAAFTAYTPVSGTATAATLASVPGGNSRIDDTTSNNVTLATIGTIDLNSLVINSTAGRTIDLRNDTAQGILRLGTSGAILLAGGSHTIGVSGTAGTLTAGGFNENTAGELAVMAVTAGTINSVIADNGTGKVSFTKNGSGTLTLAGENTFTGLTTVASGTLSLSRAGGTLSNTAPVVVSGGTLAVAQADTVGTVTLASGTISGVGVLTGSSYLLTDTGTISAILGGTGTLTKTGAGTAVLSGNNTFTGLTEVQAGTLSLSRIGGTLANTVPVTVSGGTLEVAQADTVGVVTLSSGTISGAAALTGSSFLLTNTGAISGSLAGTGTLTKTGAGTVTLSGNNTYTGLTDVREGTLSLNRAGGTLATAPVTISGGTLNVAQADTVGVVTLSSGLISGAATLTGSSYFLTNTGVISAVLAGGVTLTKTGAGTATLTGANTYTGVTTVSGGTLSLGHATNTIANTAAVTVSGGTLDVANPDTVGLVTLASGTISGAAALTGSSYALTNTGIIGATLAGTGGLGKTGVGTATLTGANTYTGTTTIGAGVLRLDHANALPGGIGTTGGTSSLTFNGGVIGLGSGDFTRSLNVAGTAIAATFTGAGGWAAYGADRVVDLGGAAGTVTWATAGTGFNGQRLILGASTATHTVDLKNPIDLGAAFRTVQVDDGAGVIDGKLSGVLSGVGGGLSKTGTGTLVLTAANTYTGATTVGGGTLALDFSVNNPASVLSASSALTLTGGTLSIKGKSAGTTAQTVAGLTLNVGNAGNSAISLDANGGSGTLLALGAITRSAGYLDFTLPAGPQSATNGITTTASLVNGILGAYATVGSNWASLSGSNIVPLATYTDVAALGGTIASLATSNVRINSAGAGANLALGAATTTISTLLQNTTTAATVDTLGKTLQTSGIMLGSGRAALTLGAAAGNGALTAATAGGEVVLINNSDTGSNLTVNAIVQDNSSATRLAKLGPGTVVLAGANTFTGLTTVVGGKLTIAATGTLGTTSGVALRGGEFNYNSTTALAPGVTFNGIGSTLSGSGTLTQLITIPAGNTLAPGNAVGTLSFGTGLTLAGTYAAQLGTPGPLATPATGVSDRAVVTGNLTLTGATLSLSDNAGANGQGAVGVGAYRLLTFTGTRVGTFAGVINPLSATLHENVVYTGTSAGTVDLSLFRLAAANTLTTPLNLGAFHVGGTAGTALSLTNTAASDGFSEKLNASLGSATGDAVVSGSFSQLAAQATNNTSLQAGFSTATLGNKSGTATLTLGSDGTGTSGYGITALGTQTLNLTGTVYSGLMAWSGAAGGAWNANSNWTDTQAAAVHAAPGLDAGFTGVDTATFGNTAGNVTVNLNGAAPSVNALTFNNTGSYTVAQGSGNTGITLAGTSPGITAAGTHTIATPIAMANNATITATNPGDSLTVSGVLSGSGMSLTKTGAGMLTLNGANTYTGTTTVANGTLAIGAGGSLANTAVTVQATGTLAGSGTIGGSTTIQGISSPGGTSVGIQTFSNSLALAASSHLQWQLTDNLATGRGTAFDGLDVTGGSFAITPGATLDLSFAGAVNFTSSFWDSNQTWTLVDLFSGVAGDGGTDLFTLGAITGGGYNSAEGAFSTARVADANSKQDVVLKWTPGGGTTTSPYQIWIDSYPGIPAADRDPQDDPDRDGVINLAEFAFKGVPNDAAKRGWLFSETKDSAVDPDSLKELTFTCAVRRSAVAFVTNGNHAQTATIDGVTYTIEGSTALTGTWNSAVSYVGKSDAPPAGSGLPNLASTDWEYRTFSAFNGLPGSGYLRASVSIASSGTATPFETWINSYPGIPVADREPQDDPDHDGVINLAEFAFDGGPDAPAAKGLFFTEMRDNAGDPDSLKELTYTCAVRRSTSVNFTANGDGAQTATIDGVTYTIEGSATLTGTWNSPVAYIGKSDTPPAGSGLPNLAATAWEYRTFSAFNGLPGKGFLRAKITGK